MKKVMIAAGGTGGHIYPALALAEILKKEDPECEVVFFGSDNRMEADLIPQKGYRFYGLTMSGMNGGVSAKLKSLVSLLKAQKECKTIIKKENPDICIGFGNYISVPFIMSAHKLHIPTMISEQNSYLGKANLMLTRYVDAIELAYSCENNKFPREKARRLGNPQATIAAEILKENDVFEQYHLDRSKPLVVFMMGSLGSTSVSKVIDEACASFKDINVVISKGKVNDHVWISNGENIRIVDYVDGKQMLRQCDLAVCRAGATTLCEISAIGSASILIPSPYVPNNHQYYNAMELVEQNAACMIEEKDLTKESLGDMVNELIKDKDKLRSLRENAKRLGNPRCAYDMVDWIKEITNE